MEIANNQVIRNAIVLTLEKLEAETILAELRRVNLSPTVDEKLVELKHILHRLLN